MLLLLDGAGTRCSRSRAREVFDRSWLTGALARVAVNGSSGTASGRAIGSGGGNDGKGKVLSAVNLVELIGKTVALKRRGKNYIGLCPFHSEKTPSFNVDPVKQYFKCFGCKEAGNAIDFVMKRDRLSFIDALKQLADEYNIELPQLSGARSQQNSSERQVLLEAHSAACSLFEKLLSHPQHGQAAPVSENARVHR